MGDLELQNATLELGQQKLLKHIAQLAAENEELKRSAEERKKLRSGEARLNKMHSELKSEAKKLANGYDADGFPIPPLRPKALSENVAPSPQVVTGTSLLFAETLPTDGQHRKSAPAVVLHGPTSPVVKMSPRCEFFRIGGRGRPTAAPLLRSSRAPRNLCQIRRRSKTWSCRMQRLSSANRSSSKVWMRSQTRTHSKCGHMRRLKAASSTSEKGTTKPE